MFRTSHVGSFAATQKSSPKQMEDTLRSLDPIFLLFRADVAQFRVSAESCLQRWTGVLERDRVGSPFFETHVIITDCLIAQQSPPAIAFSCSNMAVLARWRGLYKRECSTAAYRTLLSGAHAPVEDASYDWARTCFAGDNRKGSRAKSSGQRCPADLASSGPAIQC